MNIEALATPFGEIILIGDDLPRRRTVVLLHGLGGDRNQALDQVDLPPDSGIRRLALEMRAHGLNDTVGPRESLNVPTFAEEVAATLRRERDLGMESCVLVGVSMGAAITLEVAHRYPESIDAFVLIRPAWAGVPSPDSSRIFSTIGRILREHGPAGRSLFAENDEYLALAEHAPVMAASLMKQFDRDRARERACVLEEVVASSVPTLQELRDVDLPSLVVAAPGDPVHVLEYGLDLASSLPRATFELLPAKQATPSRHEVALRAHVSAFVREHLEP